MAEKLSKKKLKYIKNNYPEHSTDKIAKELRIPKAQVIEALEDMGVLAASEQKTPDKYRTEEPVSISRRAIIAIAISYAVLALIIYSNALNNPFLYDDHHSILDNYGIREISNIGKFFTDPGMFSYLPGKVMYRPLLLTTYALNYWVGEYSPLGWHIVNICFHVINGLLVFLIISLLSRKPKVAAMLGAIFICHPLATEGVTYLSARSSLMAGTFFFSSFLLYIRYSYSRNIYYFIGSILCYVPGLFTKENLLIYPVCILFFELFLSKESVVLTIRRRWFAWVIFFAIALLFVYFRQKQFKLETFIMPEPEHLKARYVTQIGMLTYYLRLIFLPIDQNAFHFIILTRGATVEGFPIYQWPVFSLCLFLMLFLGGAATKSRIFIFGILWYLISLIPESAVPLNQIANERRLYVPLFGVLLALSTPISALKADRKYRVAAIAVGVCVISCLGLLTIKRNTVWSSEYALFRDVVTKAPQTPNGWHGYAFAVKEKSRKFEQEGNTEAGKRESLRAKKALERSLAKDQLYAPSLILYGVVLADLHEYEKSREALEKSFIREPQNPRAHFNYSLVSIKLADLDIAEYHAKLALEYNPRYADAYNNLGVIEGTRGNIDMARYYFNKVLELNPEHQTAIANLKRLRDKK